MATDRPRRFPRLRLPRLRLRRPRLPRPAAVRAWAAGVLRRNWRLYLFLAAAGAAFYRWIWPDWERYAQIALYSLLVVLQIVFYMLVAILQFVAIFWFLGRARVYWIQPGETGITFKDYKGNPEVLEVANRIVILLRGVKKFKEMGGQVSRGLLLVGPPGTGKSYLAQAISSEAHVPFAYASVPGDTPILIRHQGKTQLVEIGPFVDQFYRSGEADFPVFVEGYETLGYAKGPRTKGNRRHFHEAKFLPFTAVFRHKASEIYEIEYVGGTIRATGDHSVFVRGNRGQLVAKEVRELQPGEILISLPHRVGRSTDWLESRGYHFDADEGAAGRRPVYLDTGPYALSAGRPSGGPARVEVTPDFCRLLGYYAAEGCAGGRGIRLTFHQDETACIEDVRELMRTCLGIERCTVARKPGNAGVTLVFHSARAARLIADLCGTGAARKRLPSFLFDLPEQYFVEFFKGYVAGDGWQSEQGFIEAGTVSRDLAVGLNWLSRMHGYRVEMARTRARVSWVAGSPLPAFSKPAYKLTWGKDSNPLRGNVKNPRSELPRVKAVRRLPYDGYVYDLCGCEHEAFFGGERPVLLHNSAPSFQNMFFGVGNLRVMMLYHRARKLALRYGAAIVFIDEIDAIGVRRAAQQAGGLGGLFGAGLGLLNELLLQMDPPQIEHRLWRKLLRRIGLRPRPGPQPVVLTIGASVTGDTPIVVRERGRVRLVPIGELVDGYYRPGEAGRQVRVDGLEVLGYRAGDADFVDVRGVFRHAVDHIYEIEYPGGTLRATGDHSVFVRNAGGRGPIAPRRVDELRPGDVLVNLPDRGDAFPTPRLALPVAPFAPVGYRFRKNMQPAPASVEVTPELCRLFGYFMAGGSAGKSRVDFGFHRSEKACIDDVTELMRRAFNLPLGSSRAAGGAVDLQFNSAQVARFFRHHCGEGARTKHVPGFLFQLGRDHFVEFLRGWACGDGQVDSHGRLTVGSGNRRLMLELHWLCRLHGIPSALGPYRVAMRKVEPEGDRLPGTMGYRIVIGTRSSPLPPQPAPYACVEPPVVRRVTRKPFKGYVYDLCGCENEAYFGGESPVLLHNTNLPEALDPALLRPGRFDRQIRIDPPSFDGRLEVIRYYLDKVKHVPDLPIERMAADTIGYTPVGIKHVINEAVVVAHFNDRDAITYDDFCSAREIYEWGLRQPIKSMSAEEKRRIAYHEAGHCVAQYLLQPKQKVIKVTIIRHGSALGLSATKPLEERYLADKQEMLAEIQVALASRAAERLFLKTELTGVTQDLEVATRIAAAYLGWFGMGGTLYSTRAFGEHVPNDKLKKRIEKLLDEQYAKVEALLRRHAASVHAIARGLIEQNELGGAEVEAIMRKTLRRALPARPKRVVWSRRHRLKQPRAPLPPSIHRRALAEAVKVAATRASAAAARASAAAARAAKAEAPRRGTGKVENAEGDA